MIWRFYGNYILNILPIFNKYSKSEIPHTFEQFNESVFPLDHRTTSNSFTLSQPFMIENQERRFKALHRAFHYHIILPTFRLPFYPSQNAENELGSSVYKEWHCHVL